MILNGDTILEIEVMTEWSPEEIRQVALEAGFGVNAVNGRFQKVAKGKPAPLGIVRHSAVESVAVTEPIDLGEPSALCSEIDSMTGRRCIDVEGHGGNHSAGLRTWSTMTDTGSEAADSGLPGSDSTNDRGTNPGRGGEPSLSVPAPVSPMTEVGTPTPADEAHADAPPAGDPAPTPDTTPGVSGTIEEEAPDGTPVSGPASSSVTSEPRVSVAHDHDLIAVGLAHADVEVRARAELARDAVDELAIAMASWAMKSEALADIARLEAELAAARIRAGQTPGYPKPDVPRALGPRPPVGVSYAAVREWAREVGIETPEKGRPKNEVIAAYRAAHPEVA